MSSQPGSTTKPVATRPITLSGAACAAIIVGAISLNGLRGSDADGRAFETATVVRAHFVRTVPAVGEVRSFRPVAFYSDCRARPRKIIDLVPEGTWVEKGDIVCVLDSSEFRDKLNEPTIDLIRARAGLISAEATEALQEAMNARNLELSEMLAEIAGDRLRAFEEAESTNELERLMGVAAMNQDTLEQACDDFEHSQRLLNEGIVSLSSVGRAKTRLERATRERDLALGGLSLTERFRQPRTRTQLKSLAGNAQREVYRTHLRNSLATTMARANTLSKQSWVAGWERYVTYLNHSIEACTMRAPKSGEVVYANDPGSRKYIEIGQQVHYVQKVFSITDRSRLTVAGRISDRDIFDIQEGQRAEVVFDRLPGRQFNATVNWIGELPSAIDRYTPYILHHKVEIVFDESPESLAILFPGMNATAEIIVDSRDDVLQVPAEAVVEHNDEYIVILREPQELYRRKIQIGASNRRYVEVTGGLEQGQEVVIDSSHALRELADSLL